MILTTDHLVWRCVAFETCRWWRLVSLLVACVGGPYQGGVLREPAIEDVDCFGLFLIPEIYDHVRTDMYSRIRTLSKDSIYDSIDNVNTLLSKYYIWLYLSLSVVWKKANLYYCNMSSFYSHLLGVRWLKVKALVAKHSTTRYEGVNFDWVTVRVTGDCYSSRVKLGFPSTNWSWYNMIRNIMSYMHEK